MSDSDQMQLAFIAESTYGEQKTGSNLQILRYTGESLSQETDSQVSAEIRGDRQKVDVKRTNVNAGGGLDFEMSYGSHDVLLKAALAAASWSAEVTDIETEITISTTNSDNSFNDSGSGLANYVANSWIEVRGFTDPANNGFFKVVTSAAGKLTVSGGTLIDEAAGDSIAITLLGEITNGVTQHSYNIEKEYTELSNELALELGMMVDQLSLTVPSDAIVTGSFTFLGSEEQSIASSGGTGYDNAATTEVFSSIDEVLSVRENDIDYGITNFSMALANNLRTRMEVGNLGAVSIGMGTVDLSGTIQAYYASKTIMDKYLNFTTTSLVIVFEDTAGNGYIIDIPYVRYTSGNRVAGGQNTDIIADMAWTATMHPTEEVTIRIARFTA